MHNHDHMILIVAAALFAYYLFIALIVRFFGWSKKRNQQFDQAMSQVPNLIDNTKN